MKMTRKEFLDLFNNHLNICVLPDHKKRRFVSWNEFNTKVLKKGDKCYKNYLKPIQDY